MQTIFWMIVTAIVFYRIGWDAAHHAVVKEIKLLGKFYVGREVFSAKLDNPDASSYPQAPTKPTKNKS